MTIVLCTLVLNEMQWLPQLYEQHKDWPGLEKWIFVESADRVYAKTNLDLATEWGLSTDGTTEFLETLARTDSRITHIKHGFCDAADPAQGKCEARSRYLREADKVKPTYLIILDADEFYIREAQHRVLGSMKPYTATTAFVFRHREIWRPVSLLDQPLFSWEVQGGFWSIPYCRCWRWYEGLRYRKNHNTPETSSGFLLDSRMKRFDTRPDYPFFIHMGFASALRYRKAKNDYYVARGEGVTDFRSWYTDSRAAWETWTPGTLLPRGASVLPYTGPIPECFQEN